MVCIRTCAMVLAAAVCASAFVSFTTSPFRASNALVLSQQRSVFRTSRASLDSILGLQMGIIDDIVERKKKEVEALKASPPPGVMERLEKMGSMKNPSAVYK